MEANIASAASSTEENVTLLAANAAAPAVWWRRGHAYATPAVVAGDLVLIWLATRLLAEPDGIPLMELATMALVGFLFAKCFLLGLWAALGSPSTIPRWLIVGGLSFLGCTAIALPMLAPDWNDFLTTLVPFVLLAWVMIAGVAVLLLPLRRLAGWRVDFDAAYHPNTGQRRWQMGLMDYAALIFAVTILLMLGRCLMEITGNRDAEGLLVLVILTAVLSLSAGPLIWATLVRRRTFLWLLAGAAWLLVVSWSQSQLALHAPALGIFGRQYHVLGFNLFTLAFHAGGALAVVLPLAVLRPFGLKFLRVA